MSLNWRDLIGGLALLAIGAFFLINAVYLGIGTTRSMGAGYFPMLGGIFTIIVSLFIVAGSLARSGAIERPAWRPFLVIVASIAVFIVVMPITGLLPAVFVTVVAAAIADRNSRPIPVLILAVGLCIGAWLVFIVGLGLPIRLYRIPF
jgi:uncharacterized membrane-anchored protein